MFNLNPYSILAGFIFSTIGLGAFSYGRKLDLWQPRVIGLGTDGLPVFHLQRHGCSGESAWACWCCCGFTIMSENTGFPLAEPGFSTQFPRAHAN